MKNFGQRLIILSFDSKAARGEKAGYVNPLVILML